MCLSEPQAGSAVVGHRHARHARRHRVRKPIRSARATACAATRCGSRGGEHELTENIVHLVLAKIPGPMASWCRAPRGISLFIVPKKLVDPDGRLTGERNDVALAGLNHKLGYRGIHQHAARTSARAVRCARRSRSDRLPRRQARRRPALHVPHDERGAHRRSAWRGDAGLWPAMKRALRATRVTARRGAASGPAGKDAATAAGAHHRARRRQAHAAGAEGICRRRRWRWHCIAHGWSTSSTPAPPARGSEAALLLESADADRQELAKRVVPGGEQRWRSRCTAATATRATFPVEQYWRDNRLNMIHEGTHGIQAPDLLGRKVVMEGGAG